MVQEQLLQEVVDEGCMMRLCWSVLWMDLQCCLSDNLLSLLLMVSLSMNMNRGAPRSFGSV